jgi:hypothetical protein
MDLVESYDTSSAHEQIKLLTRERDDARKAYSYLMARLTECRDQLTRAECENAELKKWTFARKMEADSWRSTADILTRQRFVLKEALKVFASPAATIADGFPDHDIVPFRLGQCRDAAKTLADIG